MMHIPRPLRSTALAIVLIALLALYAAFFGGRFGFRSPVFLVLLALFTVNLLLCTLHRLAEELSGRRRWKPGPDLVHIALLLLIAAGTLSLFGRWEGQVMLAPGETARLDDGRLIVLEDFRIDRYPDGTTREWVSSVSLLDEAGGEAARRDIRVNRPVRFGPFLVYQSSWSEENGILMSGLLAVRDPSAPLVLIAIPLMAAGLGMVYIPLIRKLMERQ